jgi:hypothetical protein
LFKPSEQLFPLLVNLGASVIEDIKRIIRESEITKEDDKHWPPPDKIGRQELEIKMNREHISFTVGIGCVFSFLIVRVLFLIVVQNRFTAKCSRERRSGRFPNFLLFDPRLEVSHFFFDFPSFQN